MSSLFPPATGKKNVVRYGKLAIDLTNHRAAFETQPLHLNPNEFTLLAHLVQAVPRVASFSELAGQVRAEASASPENINKIVHFHIYGLRQKLAEVAGNALLLESVPGVGFVLSQPLPADQPRGGFSFLFSDIEGSTQLWDQHSDGMRIALKQHDLLLRTTFAAHNGYVFKTVGDGFYVAFVQASEALAAALAAQRALQTASWPSQIRLRVRMALTTGLAEQREGDYYGPPLNMAARLLAVGHGGQVLLDSATQAEIVLRLPPGVGLRNMGFRRFKGLHDPQQVFQVVAPDLPVYFPPLRTLDPRPTNLPAELTSFVGRENTIRAIGALLRRADVRLVTLTGPGGIGKTRLSVQVATSLEDEYEDGVFFVPLASIHDPDLIPLAVARALRMHAVPDTISVEALIAHLRERQALLVLDNFEQIVRAAPLVNELLRGARYLKILVTSREALAIYGEHQYPVPPLAVPAVNESMTVELLERYTATALFVQRVRARVPEIALTQRDAELIAGICISLDGLPLAIELAAARSDQFTLPEVAEQLHRHLGFLISGPRDLPARQQTLRGAIGWSYELLTDPEQVLFAQLSVFVGGWTAAAAQRLVTGHAQTPTQVAATLISLAAKNLIQYHSGLSPRFAMLESIREYAWEQLESSGELSALRQRHAAYYRDLAVGLEASLTGDDQAAAYKILQGEEDNLRAALAWSLEQEDDDIALQMGGILWRWWAAQSYLREGRSWLEKALSRQTSAQPALRAAALWGAGRLAFFQADDRQAEEMLEESLALYGQIADQNGIAWVLDAIGAIYTYREVHDRARALFEESLALHRVTGNRRGISHTIDDLGQLAFQQGDIPQATHLFTESLQLRRQSGSPEGIAVALVNLSEVLGLQGDTHRAETLLQEGLHLYRQLNQPSGVILCLSNLGDLKVAQGDSQGALSCYTESLHYLRGVEQDERELLVESLVGLAQFLQGGGQTQAAARILGAAESRMDSINTYPSLRRKYEHQCEAVRSQLGTTDWARAWEEGQTLTLLDIIDSISYLDTGP
ncbi:MAG: tetratricopeptide repeat protein [Caldilineaceae bacterium]